MEIKKIVRVLIPLAVHIAAQAVTAVLFSSIPYLKARSGNSVLMTTIAAILTLPVLILLWRRDRKYRPCCPEKNPAPRSVRWWVWILIIIGGMACSGLSAVITALGPGKFFTDEPVRRLFAADLPLQFAGLCFLVPITEELLFRGLTYERSREIMLQRTAVIFVSAVFALYHGNMLQMLYAFPMSIIMQELYIHTGTLAGPVVFHISANALSVIIEAMR